MPHPKNRLKLSGDVHPPELEYGLAPDDEPDLFETEAAQRSEILHQAGADGHPLRPGSHGAKASRRGRWSWSPSRSRS